LPLRFDKFPVDGEMPVHAARRLLGYTGDLGGVARGIGQVQLPRLCSRAAWRFAAGVGLLLAAGCAWDGTGLPDPRSAPREAAAEILSRAIQLDTTNPPGNEAPLAALFVDLFERHGVDAKLIETPSGDAPAGRAAAWARVRGSGAGRPIVLLSHLDVVPADRSEWKLEPFAGLVGGGYVVGRGALDAKGVSVVHLMALLRLAQREQPLSRDVIFLATPDEELGGRAGSGWLVHARRDLLHDAEYLLTEGGGITVAEGNTPPIWGVAVAEKSPCWIRVSARGTPGHSSAPPRDAAVPRLVAALERVRRLETEVRVTPEVERMFAALAPYAPEDDRAGYAQLAAALKLDPVFRSRFLADTGRAALVRNSVTITVLEGSPRTNILPAQAHAHLDARLLPGEQCDAFVEQIRLTVADPGVTVDPILSFPSRSAPAETPLFEAVRAVAAEIDPGAAVVPRVIAGFTDAHYYRDLGIVAYGFVPRWLPPSESRGIHGPNERISIDNLERGVHALLRILEELDRQPPP
jgi:acetylornithine deacetylase/succinyl-diaminopimelate desuccinylase-like protein